MSDQSSTAKTIFLNALEMSSPEVRRDYIAAQCGDDEALSAEVQALLRHHEELGSFLEPAAATQATSPLSEYAGSTVGPYKLLEQIGEGGMGIVFMAEQQEPVRRRVAIKLIKPGMDTRQVIVRFEVERQALAVMDHPNIARVFDAGSTLSGHPYFVMELVRGVPITVYCDENHLSVPERLELFASLCQAIQHAHTKGIIHRDIKPTNVLITQQDGRPTVKVIDFGVAKAMGQQLTDKTLFTNFALMIGTPLYMSPEQAEKSGVDIDTRSDIYSLGVLLYELLTGSTPVDAEQFKQAAFDEIRRIIREDEPPTPSARISGSRTLPAIAAHRHIEPTRLSKVIRGELDWIVMKALEKDRNRRYETANAFAADLLHYLHDEPVQACPLSTKYRLGKFCRRNRIALTTATLVAASLVLGIVMSTWQAIRAERARVAEAKQRQLAEEARASEIQQRKAAQQERAEADRQRAQAEANFQRAGQTVDEFFTLVSEDKLLNVPGLAPLRRELLLKALQFYQETAVQRESDPDTLADLAVTYLRVAQINHAVGRNDDFAPAITRALDIVDRLRREYPQAAKSHRRLAGFWKGYRPSHFVSEMPKNPAAVFMTLQRAVKAWQELVDQDLRHLDFQSDLASLCFMTGVLMAQVDERESLRYYERAAALLEKLVTAAPNVDFYQADLARVKQYMVGELNRAGRQAEAELAYVRSLELRESLVARFPDLPQHRLELAIILGRPGTILKHAPLEAEKMWRRSLDLNLALIREQPEMTAYYDVLSGTMSDWARYALSGNRMEQQALFEKTVQQLEALALGVPFGANLAKALTVSTHKLAQARPMDQRQAFLKEDIVRYEKLAAAQPDVADYRRELARTHNLLGIWLRNAGQNEESAVELRKAQELWRSRPDPSVELTLKAAQENPEGGNVWHMVFVAYYNAGDWEKCLLAIKKKQETLAPSYWESFYTAMAHWQLDHREEALHWFHEALGAMNDWPEPRLRRPQAEAAFLLGVNDPGIRVDEAKQLEQRGLELEKRARQEEAKEAFRKTAAIYSGLAGEFPKVASYGRSHIVLLFKVDAPAEEIAQAMKSYPTDDAALNTLAWDLAAAEPVPAPRALAAVEAAQKSVAIKPRSGNTNTLGVAHYRAGNWQQSIEWLTKSNELLSGGDSLNWYFLSMAHAQMGDQVAARQSFDKAVEWQKKYQPANQELKQFHAEAESLLKSKSTITKQTPGKIADVPSPSP